MALLPGDISRLARHRITFEEYRAFRIILGRFSLSGMLFFRMCPAEVRGASAREQFVADQNDAVFTHVITIRYWRCESEDADC